MRGGRVEAKNQRGGHEVGLNSLAVYVQYA